MSGLQRQETMLISAARSQDWEAPFQSMQPLEVKLVYNILLEIHVLATFDHKPLSQIGIAARFVDLGSREPERVFTIKTTLVPELRYKYNEHDKLTDWAQHEEQ